MTTKPNTLQLIWGIALVAAGVGVFFRIPQVMPKIATMEQFTSALFFIRICFYLLGIALITGGAKKLSAYFKDKKDNASKKNNESS